MDTSNHLKKNELDEDTAKLFCLRIAEDLENEKISLEEAAQIASKLVKNQEYE